MEKGVGANATSSVGMEEGVGGGTNDISASGTKNWGGEGGSRYLIW